MSKGGKKPACCSCNASIIYSAIIIAMVIIADLMDAWGQGWPKLVILLMALYILLEPIKPFLGKNKKIVIILMTVVTVLLAVGIIMFFMSNNVM